MPRKTPFGNLVSIIAVETGQKRRKNLRHRRLAHKGFYYPEPHSSELFMTCLDPVWEHTKRGFLLTTAFQNVRNAKNNERCHQELKGYVRETGLGFFEIEGAYTGEGGTKMKESTLIVPYLGSAMTFQAFATLAGTLRTLFSPPQYAVLLVTSKGEVSFVTATGLQKKHESFRRERIELLYNEMKGKHGEFRLKGVRVPSNMIAAVAMTAEGYLLV